MNERRRRFNEFHISEVRVDEEEKDADSSDLEDYIQDLDSAEQLSSSDDEDDD